MYKHKHHIIPRHMGGTDDPSNLIELTVEEHADAHRKLYEQYGKREDYLAWKGLSGKIGKEYIMNELASLGGKNSAKKKMEAGTGITEIIKQDVLKLDLCQQIKIQLGGLTEKIISFAFISLMVMKEAQHQIILVKKYLGLSGGMME